MTSTKEKGLQTALLLFNKYGVENVTTRSIAKGMGISHGNFCYHYPSKEDVIIELYKLMMNDLKLVTNDLMTKKIDLIILINVIEQNLTVFNNYKFIMVDLVQITRKIPAIKKYYKAFVQTRKAEFEIIIDNLIRSNIFKKEEIKGQYNYFLTQLFIIGDYWLSHAELLFDKNKKQKINFYTTVFYHLLYPHLTDSSKKSIATLML